MPSTVSPTTFEATMPPVDISTMMPTSLRALTDRTVLLFAELRSNQMPLPTLSYDAVDFTVAPLV